MQDQILRVQSRSCGRSRTWMHSIISCFARARFGNLDAASSRSKEGAISCLKRSYSRWVCLGCSICHRCTTMQRVQLTQACLACKSHFLRLESHPVKILTVWNVKIWAGVYLEGTIIIDMQVASSNGADLRIAPKAMSLGLEELMLSQQAFGLEL